MKEIIWKIETQKIKILNVADPLKGSTHIRRLKKDDFHEFVLTGLYYRY